MNDKRMEDKRRPKYKGSRAVGEQYEQLAAACLLHEGYRLLEKNYRTPRGEIDLIAEEAGTLCFIEVKFRKDALCGLPSEAVDRRKQAHLLAAAKRYLTEQGLLESETDIRFDVVELLGRQYRLIRNAF